MSYTLNYYLESENISMDDVLNILNLQGDTFVDLDVWFSLCPTIALALTFLEFSAIINKIKSNDKKRRPDKNKTQNKTVATHV
jgi:hypothetical protein